MSSHTLTRVFVVFAMTLASIGAGLVRAADIPTAQIDSSRTMAYSSEIRLTTSNVNVAKFGKIFSRTVDGAIFAQPLYLEAVTIGSTKVNVVYVVTSHNNVYAFDADVRNASSPIRIWDRTPKFPGGIPGWGLSARR